MTTELNKPHFFDLDPHGLEDLLATSQMPAYRVGQVFDWVYRRGVADPHQMTNLAKPDRVALSSLVRFTSGDILEHQIATDATQKLLMNWENSHRVRFLRVLDDRPQQTECVLIPSRDDRPVRSAQSVTRIAREPTSRTTACISSQVGCPVGCHFCASGLGGLEANLTRGQIVEQVWRLGRIAGDSLKTGSAGRKGVTHVVFMGMGEPLANLEEVTAAVRTLTADWGMGISARRITISTVGLPAQIRRLAAIKLPVTLALSLHAPNDDLRRRLIPWAHHVTIPQLIDAGRYYFNRTGREVTLEYILLHGVNDQPQHAHELAQVAKQFRSNVNLIRYNEVKGLPYSRPRSQAVHDFQTILRRAGVNTHIRASRGRDIAAACGQLRHERTTRLYLPRVSLSDR